MSLIKSKQLPTITIKDSNGTTVINQTIRTLFGIKIGREYKAEWTGNSVIMSVADAINHIKSNSN